MKKYVFPELNINKFASENVRCLEDAGSGTFSDVTVVGVEEISGQSTIINTPKSTNPMNSSSVSAFN